MHRMIPEVGKVADLSNPLERAIHLSPPTATTTTVAISVATTATNAAEPLHSSVEDFVEEGAGAGPRSHAISASAHQTAEWITSLAQNPGWDADSLLHRMPQPAYIIPKHRAITHSLQSMPCEFR